MTTQCRTYPPPILVVGGDKREEALVALWRREGGVADLYGHALHEKDPPPSDRMVGRLVVGPPSGIDANGRVRAPRGSVTLSADGCRAARGVVAGAVAEAFRRALTVPCAAYREREDFAWPNAVPTAEGALAWALATGGRTLARSRVVVAGLGRVGTALAQRCRALGAEVVVLDRDEAARGRALTGGLMARPFGPGALSGAELVFNTVPEPIFDREAVAELGPAARVLDLASLPGGFTAAAQAHLGARLTADRSVPGRVAPETAAEILAGTIRAVWCEWRGGANAAATGGP